MPCQEIQALHQTPTIGDAEVHSGRRLGQASLFDFVWYDCGPREGELPRKHYRVNIRPADRALSRDIRTQELERVERALREAFGWDG
jgi:hypothetical protein